MQRPPDVLEPVAGLTREIGLMLAGLEEVRDQTKTLIADLSTEELAARPLPSFNQIGGLVLHIGENEFWWIQSAFAGIPISDEDRKFAHLDDSTETDFRSKGYDAYRCIEFLDAIHRRSIDTLKKYDDSDLDKVGPSSNDRRLSSSLRWVLHHLIDHEAHHKGQISIMKRMLREGFEKATNGL